MLNSRSKKRGISTFIAVLLLMVLAVSAGVVIYAYVMGYLGSFSAPNQNRAAQVQSVAVVPGQVWVYLKNIGTGSIPIERTDSNIQVYINDKNMPLSTSGFTDPHTDTLKEMETVKIILPLDPNYFKDGTNKIKIVTSDGVFAETLYKIDSVTGGSSNSPPVAAFSSAPTGLTVQFTDGSTDSDGTIATWAWTFGDGQTSTAQNPSNTYAAAGTYTVRLTVTDNGGATNYVEHDVVLSIGNSPPVAAFSFVPTGLTVQFTDGSTDSDGTIASRAWTFGDGQTSTAQNPSNTYAAAGTYTVRLTVTDDDGATNYVEHDVTVSVLNSPPTAAFSFVPTGLTVQFTDGSTDSDGTIASWSWDFGDTGTSTAPSPSHAYVNAGTYTVTLIVTDDDGATNYIDHSVTVSVPNSAPVAAFTFTPTGLTVQFTDGSTDSDGTIASWAWTFGDTGTSTSQSPSHTYAAAGTYTVRLTVTDDDGATNYVEHDVTVTAPTPITITLRPNNDASVNLADSPSSGSNYQKVDEITSDGDSTYVYDYSEGGYTTDRYELGDHGSVSGTINSVVVHILSKRYIAGGSTTNSYARTVLRTEGNSYYSNDITLTNTYTDYTSTTYTTNPSGGSWTWTAIDSLQAGVSLNTGDDSGTSQSWAFCTQVWVVVTYTP